jgi:hypothetical protein
MKAGRGPRRDPAPGAMDPVPSAMKKRGHRRAAQPSAEEGDARELYEGRDAGSDPAATATSPDETPSPLSHKGESTPEYAGEFEQRTPGARGTGPAGEIRSRERLLESLRGRIASDPEFADCDIDLELEAQGVRLSGTVSGAPQRTRLRHLVEAAGMGRIDDQLRVDARLRETRAGRGS